MADISNFKAGDVVVVRDRKAIRSRGGNVHFRKPGGVRKNEVGTVTSVDFFNDEVYVEFQRGFVCAFPPEALAKVEPLELAA
jgi:hypothetical protein